LEELQQVSFFRFHTWVHNISTIFTLPHPFLISSPLHLVLLQARSNWMRIFSTEKTFHDVRHEKCKITALWKNMKKIGRKSKMLIVNSRWSNKVDLCFYEYILNL
jgi:hypothetical protein